MKGIVNGRIKSLDKVGMDTGYFYGYGLFETLMIREGTAIFLGEHLNRLNTGLKILNINKSVAEAEVHFAIRALGCYNSALKINVSEKNTVFSMRTIPYTAEHYANGAKLCVSKVHRNPTSPSVSLKSMNYLDNILEMQKAKDKGYQDVLFLNYNKEVCETAVANIFMFDKDKLITPTLSSGMLNGIIRQWLLTRYSIEERVITLEELVHSDGVFITNSLMGIMKIVEINNQPIPDHLRTKEITLDYVKAMKEEQ
jgi:4-amino-4-deoxychorismate lyase